jgi:hypothetical protein
MEGDPLFLNFYDSVQLLTKPDSPDPALAPWFESLKQPGTGASCCSIADCRTVEFRQDRDGYEVLIDGRWNTLNRRPENVRVDAIIVVRDTEQQVSLHLKNPRFGGGSSFGFVLSRTNPTDASWMMRFLLALTSQAQSKFREVIGPTVTTT